MITAYCSRASGTCGKEERQSQADTARHPQRLRDYLCSLYLSAGAHRDTAHTHTSNKKDTGQYMTSSDRKFFICTGGGEHNRTPTQAHTSRYSRHLRHVLESVGLHRRYSLRRKIQRSSLCGAGACAHERHTGVVAAEGAVAKGHRPRLGLDAGRPKTASRAQQLIPIKINRPVGRRYDRVCARVSVRVQMKLPVSRRNRELGRKMSGILTKQKTI